MKRLPVTLVNSKRFVVFVLVAYFLFCFGSGGVMGLFVRTPAYPGLGGLPVYPHSQALVDRSGKSAGLASPTPVGPDSEGLLLTSFEFQTDDAPGAVLAFYRELLVKKYGFQVGRVESPDPNNTTLNLVKELPDRARQIATLTVTRDDTGATMVKAELHTEPTP